MFTLDKISTCSAGVFEVGSETKKIRTLYSGVRLMPGDHEFPTWDGLDDWGDTYTGPATEIRVITSDIEFVWQGGIGNNSSQTTGLGKHANYQNYRDMWIEGDMAYLASGFAERRSPVSGLNLSSPLHRSELMKQAGLHPVADRICSDGEYLYMACTQPYDSENKGAFHSYVIAAPLGRLHDRSAYLPFQGDVSYTKGEVYMVGDRVTAVEKATMSGIAVQRSGKLLAITRSNTNSLRIVDKRSGVLLQEHTYPGVSLPLLDENGNIYLVQNDNAVYRGQVGTDGSIGNLTKIIDGTLIQDISFNQDNTVMTVADETAQGDIIRAFTVGSWTLAWELGRKETYASNSLVYDDKFMFSTKGEKSFVRFTANGHMWVGDSGNSRLSHFDADRNFVETVIFQGNNYQCRIDEGDPSRMFIEQLEFEVDPDKLHTPDNRNNYWKLKRNWRRQLDAIPTDRKQRSLDDVTTLSNGRTYCIMMDNDPFDRMVYEVTPENTLRDTGLIVPNEYRSIYTNCDLYPDGNGVFRYARREIVDEPIPMHRHYEIEITGFDANHNPIFGPETKVAEYVYRDEYTPHSGGPRNNMGQTVGENKDLVVFQGGKQTSDGDQNNPIDTDFHLGLVKRGGTELEWVAAPSVIYPPGAPFPRDGSFDVRKSVKKSGAGGICLTYGDLIIWNYFGEFWENGQANRWNVFHKSGLFLYQFGTDSNTINPNLRPAEYAGNVFSGNLVEINGKLVLLHNDEGHHGMAHIWYGYNYSDVQIFVEQS